ncbi:MAG: vWA domain-containing protein, partial [Candidatus Eremiobacterota bacterium]
MIEFSRPLALVLLVFLVPVWGLWARSRAGMAVKRRPFILAVRLLIVLSMVLALAGPRMRLPSDRLTVLFLVDRSHSTLNAPDNFGRSYVAEALKHMSQRDRVGMVVFGRDAGLEVSPGKLTSVPGFLTVVDQSGTDLAGALRFTWAAFPADSSRRVILLSDGNPTTPGAVEEARLARALGIEVWTVPYPTQAGVEARVDSVEVPPRPSVDEPFEVRVTVWSSAKASGQLSLTRNDRPMGRLQVELEPGPNVFLVTQRVEEEGAYDYQARIELNSDQVPQNNKA